MTDKIKNAGFVFRMFMIQNRGYFAIGISTIILLMYWLLRYFKADIDTVNDTYMGIKAFYCILAVVAFIFSIGLGIVIKRMKELNWQVLMFVITMSLGLLYMFVLPPFGSPDESSHFASAYRVSNTIMFKDVIDENGKVLVRNGDISQNITAYPTVNSYKYIISDFFKTDKSNGVLPHYSECVKTTPMAYLPQALGITVARLLNLGYIGLVMMGRLFNLTAVSICMSFAIKWIPFGKRLIFVLGTLPMTMNLISSYSYDGFIMAMSFMFIAYCGKLAYEKEIVETKDIVIIALLLALLAPCKIIYAPIVGVCLIVKKSKFSSTKQYLLSVLVVAVAVVGAMIIVNASVLTSYVSADTSDAVVSWSGEQMYTISYLLENPNEFIGIMVNTIKEMTNTYYRMMIGTSLGSLDPELMLDNKFIYSFTALLILSIVPVAGEKRYKVSGITNIWSVFLFVLMSLLILFSMLIAWTPIGYGCIAGVQGRYFIPIVPLVLLPICNNKWFMLNINPSKFIIYATCIGNLLVLFRMFSCVIMSA